jgi:hypothetical protein
MRHSASKFGSRVNRLANAKCVSITYSTALTPSTVATDMAKRIKIDRWQSVMQAEDIAELIIAQLKLNP